MQNGSRLIQCVYDIGAHTGQWTKQVQKQFPSQCEFYLFEANACHVESIRKTFPFPAFEAVLADSEREVNFYSTETRESIFKGFCAK
jgi:hypothetical protein